MSSQNLQDNLFKALGLFLEAFRPYVVSVLRKEAGDKWPGWYFESLSPQQKDNWDIGIQNGTEPENLIDFHNLKKFSLKYKDLLRADFGNKVTNLPTWLDDIAEVRHKANHYQELDSLKVQQAYLNMINIANRLKMDELEQELLKLRDIKESSATEVKDKKVTYKATDTEGLIPWFLNVTPHLDIKQGHLDESVFAANLSEVVLGNGREIYQNPAMFFSKTCFTAGLKTVARRVIRGLDGEEDAENRVISLQTGFGGGKTHTLISLYHLAQWGKKVVKSEFTKELTSYTGNPQFDEANIAVFTNKTNDPTQGRETDSIHIQTLWGELAYQLGGAEAYNIIKANDENRTAPKGLFKKVLELTSPALILIDELADYCVSAAGISVGASTLSDQTISFVQELSEAVAGAQNCVLVATLPASAIEVATSPQAAQILTSLSNRLARVGADTKPVADEEIFEVIRRRLFEELGDAEHIDKVISTYMSLYRKTRTELPSNVAGLDYKEKLIKSYPFHPELIDMFRIRWASNHDFQRTRGVLRLLASIVSDLWKRQSSLTGVNALIHTSDVNFGNLDALSGQLKKLYGNGYDAVMTADVTGTSSNAFKLDKTHKDYGTHFLFQGVASTILLGSFGSTGANKGISVGEIKLCVIKPGSFNHNNVNGVLDMLEDNAYYLYYSSAGAKSKRYWFHTKPNINILINKAMSEVDNDEIKAEILKRVNNKVNGIHLFSILVNPSEEIPEQQKPSLIILGPDHLANPDDVNAKTTKDIIKKFATKKGNSERIYRNTMLFLLCSEIGVGKLNSDLKEYLACVKIREEYQSQLEKEQKDEIRDKISTFSKQVESSLVTAYSIVIKYYANTGIQKLVIKQFRDSLDLQVNTNIFDALKNEEWMLESVGLGPLRKSNLFPTVDTPIRAKDIYEAFIRFDDKPMITGIRAVQDSLLRYCNNGEFAIASGEPGNFTKVFYKENVPFFDITDTSYWVVDKSLYKVPEEEKKSDEAEDTGEQQPEKEPGTSATEISEETVKSFRTITISGKVDVANYNQVFSSFIMPLVQNKVEIEVKIKGSATQANPITENSQQYKITKESATQLGLDFEEEE